MNLVGIVNENEFYTNHYLSEIFEIDIKEQISSWQEKENESDSYTTPFKKLRGMGPKYLELLKDLSKKSNKITEKIQASRNFYKTFLGTLGYDYAYSTRELDDFSIFPFHLLGKLTKMMVHLICGLLRASVTRVVMSLPTLC